MTLLNDFLAIFILLSSKNNNTLRSYRIFILFPPRHFYLVVTEQQPLTVSLPQNRGWMSQRYGQSIMYTTWKLKLNIFMKYCHRSKYDIWNNFSSWDSYTLFNKKLIHCFECVYVSVNLWNQAICKLSENFRQFVKYLFQSINLRIVWKL